jgi:peroxidase
MVVAAELQLITYQEFLPVLLGPDSLAPYKGYRPDVNPGISNEFATAAYRFGHSMVSPQLLRLDSTNNPVAVGHLPVRAAFFNPGEIINNGIDPLLRGLAFNIAQRVDIHIVDDLRNFLFGAPGAGGFDLAALNIQRGRDHGLLSYNETRRRLGLMAVTCGRGYRVFINR